MKLLELLNEAVNRAPTDKGYYTPNYDEERKYVIGTVKDWLTRLDVSPEDLESAIKQAKQLPSYEKIVSMVKDTTTPLEKKNGTFTFKHPKGNGRKYMVYANGLIRMEVSTAVGSAPTRLKSPKPRVVHGDPVKSIVKIYDGAFKELAVKAEKALVQAPKYTGRKIEA